MLYYPDCQYTKIKRNGKKYNKKKQNHWCKTCGHQFIGDYALTYKDYHSKA
jgi:transposase-like protein